MSIGPHEMGGTTYVLDVNDYLSLPRLVWNVDVLPIRKHGSKTRYVLWVNGKLFFKIFVIIIKQLNRENIMSKQTQAMLKSWANIFIAAVIASFLTVIVDTGTLQLDWKAAQAIIISGLVAVLPVIKNYFDTSDTRYGRGSHGGQ